MKTAKFKIFIAVIIVSSIIIFLISNYIQYNVSSQTKLTNANLIERRIYANSSSYVINNNVAQYSVYLSKHGDKYIIEAFIFFNSKYIADKYKLQNYLCLVKLTDLNHYDNKNNEEVIELKAVGTHNYYFHTNGKFIFEFNATDFSSYRVNEKNFNVDNIVVGVIRSEDYRKDLNESGFNNEINWEDIYLYKKIALPYSLINYQKPVFFDTNNRELSKTVSSCIHYTYGRVASYLVNWIEIHLSLGVAQIIIYDATPNKSLTFQVETNMKIDQRLKIIPYLIDAENLCGNLVPTQFSKIEELLKKYCLKFYELEFKNNKDGRFKHEQITSNDCFLQLSKRHEYVTYYDLDEFVFPRSFNMTIKPRLQCDDRISLCSINPFQMKAEREEKSSFYNYLDSLVEKYREGRDKNKLSSIIFQHAAYHIPNNASHMLFDDIRNLINSYAHDIRNHTIYFNSSKFPVKLTLRNPPGPNRHSFIVEEKDINHLRYLYDAYNSLGLCLYENKLFKMNTTLDKTLQRYLYFITEPNQRWPKRILYSKNVRALFIHYPTDVIPGSWELKPNYFDGHILPHFREDMNWFGGNFEGSITKLNIDFEYLIFVIKKFTRYCN